MVSLPAKVPPSMVEELRRAAAQESARRGRPVGVSQFVRETLEARLRRRQRRREIQTEQAEQEERDWSALGARALAAEYGPEDEGLYDDPEALGYRRVRR